MLCRYSRAHPYFDDVPVVVVVEAPAPLVWDACLAPLEVGDDRNRRERRGRWAAPAEPSTAPAIGALGAKPRRRRSFDAAADAAPTLLHELRSFYDQAYRLKVVKDRLLHEMRHRDWGMAQLFEILDEDGDGELDCDEIGDALRRCGVPLRDVELEELFETLDADESGTVDESEFFDWLYGRGDAWLAAKRRSDDDDPFNDRRLLRRDAVRFEDATRRRLHAFWLLVDRDGDGAIDRDEYLDLHVHLYAAMHFGGAEPPDLAEARRVAEREWDFDSQGRDGLDHDLFNLSFFQLVDAWRAAAGDAAASFADYCSFLLDRVAVVVDDDPRHVDLRWRHDPDGWLGDLPRFRSLRKAIASAVREADAMLGVLGLADPADGGDASDGDTAALVEDADEPAVAPAPAPTPAVFDDSVLSGARSAKVLDDARPAIFDDSLASPSLASPSLVPSLMQSLVDPFAGDDRLPPCLDSLVFAGDDAEAGDDATAAPAEADPEGDAPGDAAAASTASPAAEPAPPSPGSPEPAPPPEPSAPEAFEPPAPEAFELSAPSEPERPPELPSLEPEQLPEPAEPSAVARPPESPVASLEAPSLEAPSVVAPSLVAPSPPAFATPSATPSPSAPPSRAPSPRGSPAAAASPRDAASPAPPSPRSA